MADRSPTREHHVVAGSPQQLGDDVAVIALKLDDAVLDRAADAAALLQPRAELAELRIVDRDVRDRRDRLSAAAAGLAPHLHAPAARVLRRRTGLLTGTAQVAAVAGPDGAGVAVGHRTRR